MKKFKTLRKSTKELLASGENQRVDYKETSKLDSDDLVSFANSEDGGTVLLGVVERADKHGRMYGEPIGLPLTDKIAQSIESKAHSCIPPVNVEISEENTSKLSLIRVDVPPSKHKPHCTGSGTYKIRRNASNQALVPELLLEMLLNRESAKFYKNFKHATESIMVEFSELKNSLTMSLGAMATELWNTQESLHSGLENITLTVDEIGSETSENHQKTEDVTDHVYDIYKMVKEQQEENSAISNKLDSILIEHNIKDRSLPLNGIVFREIMPQAMKGMPKEDIRASFFARYPTALPEQFEEAYTFALGMNDKALSDT